MGVNIKIRGAASIAEIYQALALIERDVLRGDLNGQFESKVFRYSMTEADDDEALNNKGNGDGQDLCDGDG